MKNHLDNELELSIAKIKEKILQQTPLTKQEQATILLQLLMSEE